MEPMLHFYRINLLTIKSCLFMSIFLSLSFNSSHKNDKTHGPEGVTGFHSDVTRDI